MTNTIFFRVLRDDESVASSSSSRFSERDFSMVEDLSRYSALGKALVTLRQRFRPSHGTTQTRQIEETGATNNEEEHVNFSPLSDGEILKSSNLRTIRFTQLRIATNEFGASNVLGDAGTFRPVFKGWIDNHKLIATKPGRGTAVVVKRFSRKEFYGGNTIWLKNAKYLGRVYHPNLVKLVGYCQKDEVCLLVSEYMPRGSLEDHLFCTHLDFQPLSLSLCMKVAIGAAKGLAFLHNAETTVIHGTFQPSNILIDSDYNAKLSDFGFANEIKGLVSNSGYGIRKNYNAKGYGMVDAFYGYMRLAHDFLNEYSAPESVPSGDLDARSDVYSFGVVFLEMLLGRRVVVKEGPEVIRLGGQSFNVEKAKRELNERCGIDISSILSLASFKCNSDDTLLSIIEEQIKGRHLMKGVQVANVIAYMCLSFEADDRPTMDFVVKQLEENVLPGIRIFERR